MLYLKQSTASQSVLIGPFIDETDGISALTGLTIANTDIRLSANGGNIAGKNSGGGTHDELGYYAITLDATDTATVGRLQVVVHATGALPVYHEFWVLEEAIFDAMFAASATGLLPANVTQFGGSNGTFSGGRPEVNTTLIEGSDATNQIRDAVVDDATRIDASALNTATVTTIPAILTDTAEIGAAGAGLTALASAADLATVAGFLDTEIAAILQDTGTTLDDKLDAIDTVVDAIKAVTDLLPDAGALTSLATAAAVADLPTNADLATALGAADDAVLAAIAALENLSAAEVNAEVVDALNVDTYAEPGQGSPGATVSLAAKIGYLYKAWRNRHTQTASEYALYADDATTKDHEASVADDGTTFSRAEITTGA